MLKQVKQGFGFCGICHSASESLGSQTNRTGQFIWPLNDVEFDFIFVLSVYI